MDKAMAYIDKLAAKLGVAAEHVYGVLVNQMYVFGIVNVVVGVASLVMLAALVRLNYLIIAKGGRPSWGEAASFYYKLRDTGGGGLFMVIIVVTIAALITGMVTVPIGIMKMLNPEYYAIKEILDTIGGK
ncbi:hypothetical protein [Bacillus stratosphericus]|uniref:hypothetical protein n=1 Tax=Bacillus stratosphericus TaxID=293386 RepID=UPI001CFA00A2|nr:hypothetical protein [Bacillus stratosphericus]